MTGERTLKAKHTSWKTPVEREGYGGQRISLLDVDDFKGKRLAQLLSGPLKDGLIWVSDDELEPLEGAGA